MEKYRVKINDPNNVIFLKGKEIRTPCETVVTRLELQVLLVSLTSYGCSNYSVKRLPEHDFVKEQPEVGKDLQEVFLPPVEEKVDGFLSRIYDEILPTEKKSKTKVVLTRPREKDEVIIITQVKEREVRKNKPVLTKPREVHIPPSLRRSLIAPHSAPFREPEIEKSQFGKVIESTRKLFRSIRSEDLEREKMSLPGIDKLDPRSILSKDDIEVKIEELRLESSSILRKVLKEIEQ